MEQIILDQLITDPVFCHFYQICQIPHGSGNEQALADHIVRWAQSLGLSARRDTAGNVFIRRQSAEAGRPTVLLQAHLDMVCVDSAAHRHDFQNDPIPWTITGDLLSTGGLTSLGADDGIGVALAMSVLALDRTDFPNLEALFTVKEEADMGGALGFDPRMSEADLLINLDHTDEHEILCGSCGGMRADFRLPVPRVPVPEGWCFTRVSVRGLTGGHSGEDIHRGRGNAIVLLSRLIDALRQTGEIGVCGMHGGIMRLAIPTEAEAVLCCAPETEKKIKECINAAAETLRREFAVSGKTLSIEAEPWEGRNTCVMAEEVLPALILCPDGIFQMNEALEGMVDTSDNLGVAQLTDDALVLTLEIRSAAESLRVFLYRKLEYLAQLLGGTCRFSEEYPGWICDFDSPLTRLACEIHHQRYGFDPKLMTIHAGLEPGCLKQARPDLDAIAIGPNLFNLHTVDESLSICSVKRFYLYLQDLLTAISTRRNSNGN